MTTQPPDERPGESPAAADYEGVSARTQLEPRDFTDWEVEHADVGPVRRARMLLACGLVPEQLSRRRASLVLGRTQAVFGILNWTPSLHRLAGAENAAGAFARYLDHDFDADSWTSSQPLMRLSVAGVADPVDMASRLLADPVVASVISPVERRPQAPRPRPWHWPLRTGLLVVDSEDTFDQPQTVAADGAPVAGHLDVLLVDGSLDEMPESLLAGHVVCNAVVFTEPTNAATPSEPEVAGHVERVLAATGAVAVATPLQRVDASEFFRDLRRYMARGLPFDAAANAAADGMVVFGQPEALQRSAVAQIVADHVDRVRADTAELRAQEDDTRLEPDVDNDGTMVLERATTVRIESALQYLRGGRFARAFDHLQSLRTDSSTFPSGRLCQGATPASSPRRVGWGWLRHPRRRRRGKPVRRRQPVPST